MVIILYTYKYVIYQLPAVYNAHNIKSIFFTNDACVIYTPSQFFSRLTVLSIYIYYFNLMRISCIFKYLLYILYSYGYEYKIKIKYLLISYNNQVRLYTHCNIIVHYNMV